MDLLLGFGAGVLTLINPCVLPVLPIILISALNEHKLGPLALCAGLTLTFVSFGVFVAALGPALGIFPETIAAIASLVMIAFGAILLFPIFSRQFVSATTGASNSLSARLHTTDTTGLRGQFITGAILGAVWSPCIGPTLGGAIALAAEGSNVPWAAAIMVSFAFGISSMILALSVLSREALYRQKERMQAFAPYVRPITGAVLLVLGAALWFGIHHSIELWLLNALPESWLEFSVSI